MTNRMTIALVTRLMLLGGSLERNGYRLKLWACRWLQRKYPIGEAKVRPSI